MFSIEMLENALASTDGGVKARQVTLDKAEQPWKAYSPIEFTF